MPSDLRRRGRGPLQCRDGKGRLDAARRADGRGRGNVPAPDMHQQRRRSETGGRGVGVSDAGGRARATRLTATGGGAVGKVEWSLRRDAGRNLPNKLNKTQ